MWTWVLGQSIHDFQRLPEHPHQGVEVALILQTDIVAEARRPLAEKYHQLGQALRLAGGFL